MPVCNWTQNSSTSQKQAVVAAECSTAKIQSAIGAHKRKVILSTSKQSPVAKLLTRLLAVSGLQDFWKAHVEGLEHDVPRLPVLRLRGKQLQRKWKLNVVLDLFCSHVSLESRIQVQFQFNLRPQNRRLSSSIFNC